MGSKLVGIITTRDVDFLTEDKRDVKLRDVMTPREQLIVGKEGMNLKEAHTVMQESKKGQCSGKI